MLVPRLIYHAISDDHRCSESPTRARGRWDLVAERSCFSPNGARAVNVNRHRGYGGELRPAAFFAHPRRGERRQTAPELVGVTRPAPGRAARPPRQAGPPG